VQEFERLVDAYLDRLVHFARRRVRNVQDAEDIVQNVLTGVFRDRSQRRAVTAVGPYLYRSVANACTDTLPGGKAARASSQGSGRGHSPASL
jgi:DNA-directed RNA polymerase specialized sigma24 family protein